MLRAGRVAVLRGRDTGVVTYCVFHRVAGELQIQTLAAAPALRRAGLARALLVWLLGAAARDGLESAVLEVRSSNEPARNLYEQMGFQELATTSVGSSEAHETALILSRSLRERRPE